MGFIYLRTNTVNGKKYVGKVTTKNFKTRQRAWKSNSYRYAGKVINNARAKYGVDTFGFEILKECNDDELDQWEMYYIKELNTKTPYGYNMTDGGEGRSGSSLSSETKKKISEANKGEKHYFYGKHHSEESKKKIGEAHKGNQNRLGRKHTEETKKKVSETLKGRKLTEEQKRKISKTNTNGKNSKTVLQLDKNTNVIIAEFPSVAEVQRQLGFSIGNIAYCCRGERKSAYGFKWSYK